MRALVEKGNHIPFAFHFNHRGVVSYVVNWAVTYDFIAHSRTISLIYALYLGCEASMIFQRPFHFVVPFTKLVVDYHVGRGLHLSSHTYFIICVVTLFVIVCIFTPSLTPWSQRMLMDHKIVLSYATIYGFDGTLALWKRSSIFLSAIINVHRTVASDRIAASCTI